MKFCEQHTNGCYKNHDRKKMRNIQKNFEKIRIFAAQIVTYGFGLAYVLIIRKRHSYRFLKYFNSNN